MKGNSKIHHRPHIRPNDFEGRNKPYICRVAPFETGFEFEWLDFADGTDTFFTV